MNISDIAKLTGLTAKSIRLYEEKGLIQAPDRSENSYRIYSQRHVDDLLLIARAKRVGFSLDECRALVSMAHDPLRKSQLVKEKAQEKLSQVTEKLAELELIKDQLVRWINECPGNESSDCPIIDGLTGKKCH